MEHYLKTKHKEYKHFKIKAPHLGCFCFFTSSFHPFTAKFLIQWNWGCRFGLPPTFHGFNH